MQATLKVDVTEHEGWQRIALSGEVDIGNAARLQSALRQVCEGGASRVELDLRGVTFMDSAGLRVLIEAMDVCSHHDLRLRMFASPWLEHLFEVTGLSAVIPLHAERDDPGGQGSGGRSPSWTRAA